MVARCLVMLLMVVTGAGIALRATIDARLREWVVSPVLGGAWLMQRR